MVVVGWSGGSRELWYPKSASNTRVVGTEIALTIQNLVDNYGATWDSFWCAGHSLGAHICGHVGQRTRGGKIGRIIGLDPAGPWFKGKDSPVVGLDPSDAVLVDVIHTNGESYVGDNCGTLKPFGHRDFYPNGGGTQPNCVLDPPFLQRLEPFNTSSADRKGDVQNPRADFTPVCSHNRVLWLYIESLKYKRTGCKFLSNTKCTNPFNIPASCTAVSEVQGAMGHAADQYPNNGYFFLKTYGSEPYCIQYHETE